MKTAFCGLLFAGLLAIANFALTTYGKDVQLLGVGAYGGPLPGISVQYQHSQQVGYHLTTHFSQDRVTVGGDYQRHHFPSFGLFKDSQLGLYAGLGLQGETFEDNAAEEKYHFRLPVGGQLTFKGINLQIFTEAAGLVGPLPRTSVAATGLTGMRAFF